MEFDNFLFSFVKAAQFGQLAGVVNNISGMWCDAGASETADLKSPSSDADMLSSYVTLGSPAVSGISSST